MDLDVIAAFKKCYLRRSFNNLIKEIDTQSNENNDVIRQLWKKYEILQAIENIKCSWSDVSASTMRNAWKKIWPEYPIYKR